MLRLLGNKQYYLEVGKRYHHYDENYDINILYLNYDLKTNYIHQDEVEFISLKENCILTAVVNAFESEKVVKEVGRILNSQDTDNVIPIVKNELKIERLSSKFENEVTLKIALVYKEIKSFLMSISLEDKVLFLGKFYFNWQGAINPHKTFLKVLESDQLNERRKYEFSCKYLFDQEIIGIHFNNLPPITQDHYSNSNNFSDLFGYISLYWVQRIRAQFQQHPENLQQMGDLGLTSDAFFISCTKSDCCSGIGVQFLFENLSPQNSVVSQAIRNLLTVDRPIFHRFNISMYLICQIRDNEIVESCSFEILINLIKNPRWHDIFIKYYRTLRQHNLEMKQHLELLSVVLVEMGVLIQIEGKGGKSFTTLKEFVFLIPILAKRQMREKEEMRYAGLVFDLFAYKDIDILQTILTYHHGSTVPVDKAFYELVERNRNLFARVYQSWNDITKKFLYVVVTNEDQVLDLLSQLNLVL